MASQTLYAAIPGVMLPVSPDECLLANANNRHVMTHDVFAALAHCQSFQSIETHVEAIAKALPHLANHTQAIRQVVDRLIKQGVFVTSDAWLSRLQDRAVKDAATDEKASICVRTCDRPEQLAALLGVLAKYDRDLTVFDDSRDSESRSRNQAECRRYKADYQGVDQQDAFLAKLAARNPELSVAIQQLSYESAPHEEFTGGRIQNLIVLWYAGRRFIQFDDDLTGKCVQLAGDHDTATAHIVNRPTYQARFGAELEEIAPSTPEIDLADWLAEVDKHCGRAMASYISADRPVSVAGLELNSNDARAGSDAALFVGSGFYGQSWSATTHWAYVLEGESAASFARDRDSYYANRRGAAVSMQVPQLQLTDWHNLVAIASDGRQMLAPTIQAGRNEDRLYNRLSMLMHRSSFCVQMPMALEHARSQAHVSDPVKDLLTPSLGLFLADIAEIVGARINAQAPEDRLRQYAAQMRDYVDAEPCQLGQRVTEYVAVARGDFVSQLQARLTNSPNAPVYWLADAQAIVKHHARALLEAKDERLADWLASALDDETYLQSLQSRLSEFATLCDAWPTLWKAARDVRRSQ